jgi:hypothetical protein
MRTRNRYSSTGYSPSWKTQRCPLTRLGQIIVILWVSTAPSLDIIIQQVWELILSQIRYRTIVKSSLELNSQGSKILTQVSWLNREGCLPLWIRTLFQARSTKRGSEVATTCWAATIGQVTTRVLANLSKRKPWHVQSLCTKDPTKAC